MATDSASTVGTFSDGMQCPDPSVHEKHNRLSEQASSAALYATHPDRQAGKESPLGPDGKLSSKSAATSLKYARAQDLPSYPSHGVNVAHSAGAAAVLAKDYKMKEMWQPELSSAGSRAALLAHQKGSNLDLWQPSASEAGNSAAVLAMRNQKSIELDRGYTEGGKQNSLLAAAKSHTEGRRRAGSTPAPVHPAYPDSHNSAHNALNAANVSHRTGSTRQTDSNRYDSDAMQAARIQNLGNHMDRQMFTEHPDVAIEKEERHHQAALRASAVSMAKEMYQAQNRSPARTPDGPGLAGAGAGTAHGRAPAPAEKDLKQEAMRYIHLQEAAHKLAGERLAKLEKDMEYRRNMEYYGYDTQPQRKSRLSIRGRRDRASSDPDKDLENSDSSDDERKARKVRSQMSGLNKQMEDVEAKKQAADRASLLAAAQRRVQSQMSTMDEKVFNETGKVSDATLEQWETKARKRAEEDRAERTKNYGKTHLGGGKFMDQSEIEAIALARLQPTLNDIDKTATERRQRDEEVRLEKEAAERERQTDKAKQRLDKATAKQEKDADKARKKEEKAMAKEEKRRSKETKKDAEKVTALAAGGAGAVAGAGTVAAVDAGATSEASRPGLERLHTGDHTDAVPVDNDDGARGADLNRHISNIDTSESEDAEEDDDDLERPTTATTDREDPAALATATTSSTKAAEAEPSSPESPRKSRGFSGLFSKMSRKSKSEREPGKLSSKKRSSADEDISPSAAVATGVASEDNAARRSESTAMPRGSVDTGEHMGTDGPIGIDRKVSGLGGDPRAHSPSSLDKRQETRGSVDSAHMGTDGPIGVDTKVSGLGGDPGAASPSSFAKREGSLSPVSSLSSSGRDEEDVKRGRTGRFAKAMGLGKFKRNKDGKESKGKEPATAASKSSTAAAAPAAAAATDDTPAERTITKDSSRTDGSDNETFEEARDTFDESKAPQPAFAGQQKTESPARGTRFHEEM